ncbi:FAD-binding oxidoreductase [Halioxenophilus sp. WMMB6]|uniref:FAD-binding oxidoreductase n=1 Tax=Halioxenophilus sp. WMMB6 TaxID=3073815 RepID=UPI00295E7C38|nr:FAD-binding oxidoreductase [Halioxenophilus sp. WMMB6]
MSNLKAELVAIVGEKYLFENSAIEEKYRLDITKKYSGNPTFLLKPVSTEQVAAILACANKHELAVTVIGGQTGTCGAAVPANGGLGLSLERMNQVLEIDQDAMTMTVEAGCILQLASEAAEEHQLLLPLDLGARGSATIGGVIGTNAGGNRVLRWGMMRDMVLGLEAVLADGTVVSSLTKMLKDNAGYNWKQLLIGSEGTLGIVTKAVVRLRPLPTTTQTALLAMDDFDNCMAVLRELGRTLSGRLSSFELMWEDFYRRMSESQVDAGAKPLPLGHTYYALIEAMGGDEHADAEQFERVLTHLLEMGLVADAVLAQSERERQALWNIREEMQHGIAPMRPFRSYDVSMGQADMPSFVAAARANLIAHYPNVEVIFYGHVGDGNLHAVVSVGELNDQIAHTLDMAIYEAVADVGGSISAEHGVGLSRAPYLTMTRSQEEIALMRTIKSALDPKNILNPGKLIPS